MKKTAIILSILGLLFASQAHAQRTIEITVKNIKEMKGSIRVGLFNNEDDFLKKAVLGQVVKATATEVTVIFEDVKPGDYGVSVIHDENDNGKLDSNFIGIPVEGFAFGNNSMGAFGPPDFDKAKITVTDTPIKQVITLHHM